MELTKFSKDNTFQLIKASFLDDTIELSDEALEKKKRLRHAFAMRLNNKYNKGQVLKVLRKEYGISQATAYRDYNMAMELLGELDKTDKSAEKLVIAQGYWDIYQRNLKKGKDEIALRALEKYQALFDFEDNGEVIDPNKIQANVYNIHMSRKGNKILKKVLAEGVVDFNSMAEDAEYEDVNE